MNTDLIETAVKIKLSLDRLSSKREMSARKLELSKDLARLMKSMNHDEVKQYSERVR